MEVFFSLCLGQAERQLGLVPVLYKSSDRRVGHVRSFFVLKKWAQNVPCCMA